MNMTPRIMPENPLEKASSRPRLLVLGDIGVDMVMGPLSQWPQMGTETLMPRSEMRAGGSAGNAALALMRLGADVHLLAATGADVLGQWLRAQFAGCNAGIVACEAATSVSVGIVHTCGERNFFTTHGHLDLQDWEGLAAKVPSASGHGDIALLTGAFLLPRLRARYGDIILHLQAMGYGVAVDTGWPSDGWPPERIEEVRGWLALADHVLLNDLEIRSLSGQDDLGVAMDHLAAGLKDGATLVAKVGKQGAIGLRAGQRAAVAPPPVEGSIFDTVGAGDAFNAGYLDAVSQGLSLADALRRGCETATRTIAEFPRQPVLQPSEGA